MVLMALACSKSPLLATFAIFSSFTATSYSPTSVSVTTTPFTTRRSYSVAILSQTLPPRKEVAIVYTWQLSMRRRVPCRRRDVVSGIIMTTYRRPLICVLLRRLIARARQRQSGLVPSYLYSAPTVSCPTENVQGRDSLLASGILSPAFLFRRLWDALHKYGVDGTTIVQVHLAARSWPSRPN